MPFRYAGNLFKVQHDNGGIGDGLGKNQARFVVDEAVDFLLGRVRIEKAAFDSEFRERRAEEIEGAAIHRLRTYDIVARLTKRGRREKRRGHARSAADSRDAAFEGGDFIFQRRDGRICQAGVEISVALQIEQIRHGFRVAVKKSGALADGGDTAFARGGVIARLYA